MKTNRIRKYSKNKMMLTMLATLMTTAKPETSFEDIQ